MRAASAFAVFLLITSPAMAAPPPVEIHRRGSMLTFTSSAEILRRPNVRKHLDSGLTTSFVIDADVTGESRKGTARIDVRYDLWDERWLVTTVDADGRERDDSLPSFEQLAAWWTALALPAIRIDGMPEKVLQIHVQMDVLPFSERERSDTEAWVTRTVGLARAGSETPRAPAKVGVLDSAIATSIRRRAVERLQWDVHYHPPVRP